MVAAMEFGLGDVIELDRTDVWSADTDIALENPLRKVPTLVTDDGIFVDSTLICRYLDAKADGRLFPEDGEWDRLRLYQLADGVIEASVARTVETKRRPAETVYARFVERHELRIRDTLDVIEAEGGFVADRVDIVTITLGCALGYIDFRCPHLDWRNGRPRLAAFYERFSARPSMQATVPPAGA
jgi:glutathione S-transferase